MNDSQISLVQTSFARIAPEAAQVAQAFYAHLFEIAPDVRPLFREDLSDQGGKLMAALALIVNGFRDLDRIVPVAQQLARRHVDYGVAPQHYAPVGTALIETLRAGLGPDFDAETEAAWTTAYTTLSDVMIAAASEAR